MRAISQLIEQGKNNFVFLGEAGCGKSEIALNFAACLQNVSDKAVHFFDMDMTKSLFRSRDVDQRDGLPGVEFHYEEQFMDAPTLVGGTRRLLWDDGNLVVMDVGGNDIGARSIGGIMAGLDRRNTEVFYVLNAYRPWSRDIEHIDRILGEILAVSHIGVDEIRLISNPNLGSGTSVEDVIEGAGRMKAMTGPYKPIAFTCVKEDLYGAAANYIEAELFPIHLFLTYPWETQTEY